MLPSHLSAYQALYSTETAITAIHDELVRNINSGKVSVLKLLDLNAAFNMVDHETLLEVLGLRFGVKGTALDWIDSYLADRQTGHSISHEVRSDPNPVKFTVRCRKVRFSVPRRLMLALKIWLALWTAVSPDYEISVKIERLQQATVMS